MNKQKDSERFKQHFPKDYYRILEWKDKHMNQFYALTDNKNLHECSYQKIIELLGLINRIPTDK